MRIASQLVLLACLSAVAVAATSAPSLRPTSRLEDPAILRIRAHYAQIEREAASYRCRLLDLDGFSAEGGELEACYAGKELRRLAARYYGESGRYVERFYLWSDSLEFLVASSERYDRPLSGRVVEREAQRLYWSEGRLIRWLKGTAAQPLVGKEADERSRAARETARTFATCAANMAGSTCVADA